MLAVVFETGRKSMSVLKLVAVFILDSDFLRRTVLDRERVALVEGEGDIGALLGDDTAAVACKIKRRERTESVNDDNVAFLIIVDDVFANALQTRNIGMEIDSRQRGGRIAVEVICRRAAVNVCCNCFAARPDRRVDRVLDCRVACNRDAREIVADSLCIDLFDRAAVVIRVNCGILKTAFLLVFGFSGFKIDSPTFDV